MRPAYPLFRFQHGDHTCVFYKSEDYLLEVLTPYVADGLRRHERCFCVQSPEVLKRLEMDLAFLGVSVERERERGALDFYTPTQVYLRNGAFEPEILMDMLIRSVEDSVKRGFNGFRSAGELSWVMEGAHDCSQLLGYEAMVQNSYPGKPAIGMCQYPIHLFPDDVLQKTLDHHRYSLIEPQIESTHASLCLRTGNAEAEIVANRFTTNPKYYYVASPLRTKTPLGWGVEGELNRAIDESDALLRKSASEASSDIGSRGVLLS
jgi:hypothetical protein